MNGEKDEDTVDNSNQMFLDNEQNLTDRNAHEQTEKNVFVKACAGKIIGRECTGGWTISRNGLEAAWVNAP